MALFGKVARYAAKSALRGSGSLVRAGGRMLAVHVIPDALVPSWKTQKAFKSTASAISRPFSQSAKKPKVSAKKKAVTYSASPRSATTGPSYSKSKPPKFNKNAWGRGASLSPAAGYSIPRPTSPPRRGSPPASLMARLGTQFHPATVQRRKQKLRDFRNEPRLATQMVLGDLIHQMRTSRYFSSKYPY